jgi:hypothetical protein
MHWLALAVDQPNMKANTRLKLASGTNREPLIVPGIAAK